MPEHFKNCSMFIKCNYRYSVKVSMIIFDGIKEKKKIGNNGYRYYVNIPIFWWFSGFLIRKLQRETNNYFFNAPTRQNCLQKITLDIDDWWVR